MLKDYQTVKEKVRDYVVQLTFTDKDKIKENSLIFKEGYFDSMGFLTLISFIEGEFGIITVDDDLIEENFESINAISEFVIRKIQ